jgi:hypothetical protein
MRSCPKTNTNVFHNSHDQIDCGWCLGVKGCGKGPLKSRSEMISLSLANVGENREA